MPASASTPARVCVVTVRASFRHGLRGELTGSRLARYAAITPRFAPGPDCAGPMGPPLPARYGTRAMALVRARDSACEAERVAAAIDPPVDACCTCYECSSGPAGSHGNPLGVVPRRPARRARPAARRVAADLGFSETVFVDDAARGRSASSRPRSSCRSPGTRAWARPGCCARSALRSTALRPPAGEVPARVDGDRPFVAGRPEWAPEFELIELRRPGRRRRAGRARRAARDLAAVYSPVGTRECARPGLSRARLGIDEDEATGAAASRSAPGSAGRSRSARDSDR